MSKPRDVYVDLDGGEVYEHDGEQWLPKGDVAAILGVTTTELEALLRVVHDEPLHPQDEPLLDGLHERGELHRSGRCACAFEQRES